MDDKFFLEMVDKFNSSEITELDFNDGNVRLILKKESMHKGLQITADGIIPALDAKDVSSKQSVHLGISAQTAGAGGGSAGGGPAGGSSAGGKTGEKINSPIVGTFYSSPSPDALPFVKPGTKIKAGQTLCILEAMKMMNHLEAEFDCEIIEVHASSGELVEYGQELFTVKRN